MPKGQKFASRRQNELETIKRKLAAFHFEDTDDLPTDLRDEIYSAAKALEKIGRHIAAIETDDASKANTSAAAALPTAAPVAVEPKPAKK